jgi:prostaglandin-endoperoxide synthase 2
MFENIPSHLLIPIVDFINRYLWLRKLVNAFVINRIINVSRHRPHPWSMVHDYVSWTSLTDQHWSARHLPAATFKDLPTPEDLKSFFARKAGSQKLSTKSSCLFPAFAQYLTDGFIRTRMPKLDADPQEAQLFRKQNTSNQQIDLCTLYGRTPEQTNQLRVKPELKGKRGQLKSQTVNNEEYSPFLFEEDGVTEKTEFSALDKPLSLTSQIDPAIARRIFATGGDRVNAAPQVAMINTLLLREHNRLARALESANQGWDDERVFQTARNTMIVMFIKVVVEEYINHISPIPFHFLADPSVAWNASWNKPNWITTEFSLLYRWHSLIPDEMTWNGTVYPAFATFMNNQLLLNAGLVQAFSDMSSQAAGRLGAFNTNAQLLDLEVRAINQGRICQLDSYASYCKYVSLKQPKDFADISKDKEVVEFLRQRYKSPNDVDFYVGLFAEDAIHNSPLPPLMMRMVAVDAFSQAFTNPLLSEHVFKPETFSSVGWEAIQTTTSLGDILERNSSGGTGNAKISMTLENWNYA